MVSVSSRWKKGRRSFLFGLAIAAGMSQGAVNGATIVDFTTGGTTYSSNAATEAPAGNVLAVGGQSAIAGLTPGGAPSAPVLVLFQSQIVLDAASNGLPLNTPGVFTVTGSVFETISLTTAGTVVFSLAPGATTFNIYYGPNSPNSLAGTGFQAGALVFSGSIVSSAGNFSDQPGSPLGAFDQANPGAYPGKQTVLGTGQTALTVNETSYDNTFFNTNLTGSSLNLTISTDSQFVTAGADPSLNFFGTTPNLPTINGTLVGNTNPNGPYDIQFQSNGSGSFQVVPEPASMAMTLMGLVGVT
jgi:hypothetical protein